MRRSSSHHLPVTVSLNKNVYVICTIHIYIPDDEKKPNSCSFDQDINMVILTDDECTPDTKKTPAEVKPDSEESTDGDKPVSNDPQQKTEVSKTVADEKSPKDTVQLVKIDLTDDDPSEKEDEKVTSTVPDKSLISEESKIPEKSETNKQEAPKIDGMYGCFTILLVLLVFHKTAFPILILVRIFSLRGAKSL